MAGVSGIAGLVLTTRANLIAHFFYPREIGKNDWREQFPKDF
jgi:hypothetical protein